MSRRGARRLSYPTLPFSILVLFLLRIPLATALEATPDSTCINFCIDKQGTNVSDSLSTHTFSSDLSCLDSDYSGDNSTAIGRKFRSCVGCQQNSTFHVKTQFGLENDMFWFLFNLKSTITWCVNGFYAAEQNPKNTLGSTTCGSACAPIAAAVNDQIKEADQNLQYNYCNSTSNAFMSGVDECKKCLDGANNLKVMGNFLGALKTACDQRPTPGATVTLAQNIFSTAAPSSTSSSAAGTTSAPASPGASSLSGGAIAGIVIGAIAGLCFIAALMFVLLRRRATYTEKRAELGGSAQDAHGGWKGGVVETYAYTPAREMDAEQSSPVELPSSERRR